MFYFISLHNEPTESTGIRVFVGNQPAGTRQGHRGESVARKNKIFFSFISSPRDASCTLFSLFLFFKYSLIRHERGLWYFPLLKWTKKTLSVFYRVNSSTSNYCYRKNKKKKEGIFKSPVSFWKHPVGRLFSYAVICVALENQKSFFGKIASFLNIALGKSKNAPNKKVHRNSLPRYVNAWRDHSNVLSGRMFVSKIENKKKKYDIKTNKRRFKTNRCRISHRI